MSTNALIEGFLASCSLGWCLSTAGVREDESTVEREAAQRRMILGTRAMYDAEFRAAEPAQLSSSKVV